MIAPAKTHVPKKVTFWCSGGHSLWAGHSPQSRDVARLVSGVGVVNGSLPRAGSMERAQRADWWAAGSGGPWAVGRAGGHVRRPRLGAQLPLSAHSDAVYTLTQYVGLK